MNNYAINVLEFDKIREQLKLYAVSDRAKTIIGRLEPSVDSLVIEGWLRETTEARNIVDINSGVPLSAMTGADKLLEKSGRGIVLAPEEFAVITSLLECTGRMKRFMAGMQLPAPGISTYAASMYELRDLYDEIDRCIVDGRVDDRASAELHRIRRKLEIAGDRIKQKLAGILNSASAAGYLQEPVISTRNGRYVIPVKREHRRSVEGTVLDTSASGSTVFVEPSGIARLQEEMNLLRLEEENEVYRILATLTGIVDGYGREISINIETMVHYDFLFAKAKYSRALDACRAGLNNSCRILIKGGKHPLIGRSAVPLDFHIGDGYRALVITGPNTGGKTVALKTAGLLTLMIQAGLHVPVQEGSEFAVFTDILADIGDGQSIEQSLSTFSSHVLNISAILKCAGPDTLVIMDEVGAGTDPSEGMGFATAVLEEVYSKGATILATTHYSELKEFAAVTPGFRNGCMGFNVDSLKPLYSLKIGQPGESNAFLIALRLGIDPRTIERAHEITYKEKKKYGLPQWDLGTGSVSRPRVGQGTRPHVSSPHVSSPHVSSPNVPSLNALSTVAEHEKLREEAKAAARFHKQTEVLAKAADKALAVGDCVYISTMNRTGIVCETENSKGEVVVMVMKKKFKVNRKRLSLYIDGNELYPEDYDYDIVLESKEDRKKKKSMSKRHVEGIFIERSAPPDR